jgi:hypothetical protein
MSKVAINNLKSYCLENNIKNISPVHISSLDIIDIGPVEFIFGSMVLHHIEPFNEFALILRKTISEGGKGFFLENNSASALMIWFRQHIVGKLGVPKHGDNEEFPFTADEVIMLKRYFRVKVEYPELLFFRMIPNYLLRGHLPRPFESLDNLFFKMPQFRKYSYLQYIYIN